MIFFHVPQESNELGQRIAAKGSRWAPARKANNRNDHIDANRATKTSFITVLFPKAVVSSKLAKGKSERKNLRTHMANEI